MSTLIYLCCISLFCISAERPPQHAYTKTYQFEAYTLASGFCTDNTNLRLLKQGKLLYSNCGGDGRGYTGIDTLSLNADLLQDFVYSYQMDDYVIIGLLVSGKKSPSYHQYDLICLSPPDTYNDYVLQKGEVLRDFVLKDVNRDGKTDLLTNVVERDGILYPLPHFTDTLLYNTIKQRGEGKIKYSPMFGQFKQ